MKSLVRAACHLSIEIDALLFRMKFTVTRSHPTDRTELELFEVFDAVFRAKKRINYVSRLSTIEGR